MLKFAIGAFYNHILFPFIQAAALTTAFTLAPLGCVRSCTWGASAAQWRKRKRSSKAATRMKGKKDYEGYNFHD